MKMIEMQFFTKSMYWYVSYQQHDKSDATQKAKQKFGNYNKTELKQKPRD